MSSQKGTVLIVTVILAAIALGGYLIFQNQSQTVLKPPRPIPTADPDIKPSSIPDNTVNWEIYMSKCGFTLKYPRDWQTGDIFLCGVLRAPNYAVRNAIEDYGLFLRFSRVEKGSQTLDDYIKSKQSYGVVISGIQDKTYASLNGNYFRLYSDLTQTTYVNFIFIKDNYIYHIDWPINNIENYADEVDYIINSLKF